MGMKRPTYDVYLEGEQDPHRVVVEHRDSLGAERVCGKYGIPVMPTEAPQAHATLYVWRAMTRMGIITADYPDFANRLLVGFQKPEADPTVDAGGLTAVDPTHEAQPSD